MFENPRRGRQARNFTTNVPKILVLKSSSEQIFSLKLPLGAPVVPTPCAISKASNALSVSEAVGAPLLRLSIFFHLKMAKNLWKLLTGF